MGRVVVFLKRNVHVFTMEPRINPGKRSMLTVIPGKYFLEGCIPGSIICLKILSCTVVRRDLDCALHQLMGLLSFDSER